MDMKSKIASISTEVDGSCLRVQFASGNYLEIVDIWQLPREVQEHAMMSGLRNKLIDAAAICRDTENGASADAIVKERAVRAVHERLLAGEWNKGRRDGNGEKKHSLLARAIAELNGSEPHIMEMKLAAMTAADRKALKGNPKVIAKIAELSGPVDDGLLDALMA